AVSARGYLALAERPVERITVTGSLAHTRAQAVKDMVQPALAGGFLRADLVLMREQLEGLPWIFEATVRREWPSTLAIHVVEQRPIARWGENGFLNHVGEVFHSGHAQEEVELPLLAGPKGSASQMMATYRRLVELLAPLDLAVARLTRDERGELAATLVGGTRLLFGDEHFLERVHRFAVLYRVELGQRFGEVERVDLRYATGAAVAFNEASQVAVAAGL
ncbi:MAG: FtsQ-type POTRA domain-containing protein, partial [Halioglobus sp.]|nr:FtsQ-type POTRA domain-containing protein [Halioglobus sp.]